MPVRTLHQRQFRALCLPIIREIEQGSGDGVVIRNGERTARATMHVGSPPVPSFGCDADTHGVFVDDLAAESAYAAEEWDMLGNSGRILDASR